MLLQAFSSIVLLGSLVASAAAPGFQLGAQYSEWAPAVSAIGTDSTGALYLLSFCQVSAATGAVTSQCVTKLSPDGKTITWQNTLGFGLGGAGTAMAVDPNGGVYVIPGVQISDPTVYIAKLAADGTGFAWKMAASSAIVGNPAVAADSQGRTYVGGTIGPYSQASVIIRVNAAGTAVDYTAQVPGGVVTSIAADGTGGAFVTGIGTAPFLARITPDGTVAFNTVLPATPLSPWSVATDPNGNAVVCGTNESGIVVLRFNSAGAVTLSSVVGSTTADSLGGYDFALDAAGNAYVTSSSYTESGGPYLIPLKNSLATCSSGEWLSVLAPDGSVLQTTYTPPGGGQLPLEAPFIAIGANSSVFLVHWAASSLSPTQAGPFANNTSIPYYIWNLSPNANAQTFPLACLGNSATYLTGPVAPGGFVTLYGSGLGPQQGVQLQASIETPFPARAAGVEVTFDGTPAPLLWVQDGQINVVAPWSLTPGRSTNVCVSYNAVKTNCLSWPVAATAPAVFTVDGVHAAALNQDGSVNSFSNPAPQGSIVTVFATGLGPIAPPQADGTLVGLPLPTNVLPITAGFTVADQPVGATTFNPFDVTYAGPAPYLVAGASQINFKIGPPANQNYPDTYAGQPNINVFLPSAGTQAFAVYVLFAR